MYEKPSFYHLCFSADDGQSYYISIKYDRTNPNTADGNILQWTVTVNYLALIKSNGAEVPVMTNPANVDLLTAGAQDIAGYFARNVSLPVGEYKQVRIIQDADSTLKRWVEDVSGNKWYYTETVGNHGDDAANDAAANSKAEPIQVSAKDNANNLVPENPTGTVTVQEGKSYTFKILWRVTGLESGRGVGLVYNCGANRFNEGMLSEQHILIDNEKHEQYFTGN